MDKYKEKSVSPYLYSTDTSFTVSKAGKHLGEADK